MIKVYLPYIFVSLGAFICAMNWLGLYRGLTQGKRHSTVIFIGGASLALGIATMPYTFSSFWWVAFFVDFGSIAGLIYALFKFVNKRHR
jgi:hypothetical protein